MVLHFISRNMDYMELFAFIFTFSCTLQWLEKTVSLTWTQKRDFFLKVSPSIRILSLYYNY